MKSLKFVQKLKQTLLEVESSGSNNIFFVENDYDLARRLKHHAVQKLREKNLADGKRHLFSTYDHFINDLLSRDIFNARLKYCVVKLKELSIEENTYFDYISRALTFYIEGERPYFSERNTSDIDQLIALEISRCFEPWYRPEDIFLIDFAEQRQLIMAVTEQRTWRISNLGHYFLRMPTFEAIAFLIALEVVMTLEHYQNQYISLPLLEELSGGQLDRHHTYPYSLSLFGILQGTRHEAHLEISEFGKNLLTYVRTNLERFQDLFLFLIEAQATGFEYEDEGKTSSLIAYILSSDFLIDDQKRSIETAFSLYKAGDYLDSLRILYPVLEGSLDTAIRSTNMNPMEYRGMKSKVEKLEKEGLISTRMSTGLEIFNSRNKILHGNILENDEELAQPLFSLILAYLKRLLNELSV